MNAYFSDAQHWLRRASNALLLCEHGGTDENLHDAIIFFAFGVEKLFKGILWDVNPLFIMENPGFENACGVLYRSQLRSKSKEKADKEDKQKAVNHSVLPFQGSMMRAKEFSETVASHMGHVHSIE